MFRDVFSVSLGYYNKYHYHILYLTLYTIKTEISLFYNLFPANGLLYVPASADNLTPNSSRRKQNFKGIRNVNMQRVSVSGTCPPPPPPPPPTCIDTCTTLSGTIIQWIISLGIIHHSSSNAQLSCCKLLPLLGLMPTW